MSTLLVVLTAIITIGLKYFRPDSSIRLVNSGVLKAASLDAFFGAEMVVLDIFDVVLELVRTTVVAVVDVVVILLVFMNFGVVVVVVVVFVVEVTYINFQGRFKK